MACRLSPWLQGRTGGRTDGRLAATDLFQSLRFPKQRTRTGQRKTGVGAGAHTLHQGLAIVVLVILRGLLFGLALVGGGTLVVGVVLVVARALVID